MFRNYIKFAWRHLRKSLSYSVINITGLAIGIASIMLIIIYIQHEFSFDDYHKNKENIYRVTAYSGFNEKSWQSYLAGDPVPEMRTSFSGVEDAVNMINCSGGPISVDEKKYPDLDIFCTESNLFNIFSFPLIAGSHKKSLDAPFTTVISEGIAKKVFGNENPIGKHIEFNWDNGKKDFEITGVMKDIPANSHFKYDIFLSYESLKGTRRCLDCGKLMYAILKKDADTTAIAKQVLNYVREIDGKTYVEDVRLQPLNEIYFSSLYSQKSGDWQYIQILSAIALIILLLACGNYMNLATARYSKRSKEIGIRKVLGAYRSQLSRQFFFETMLLTLMALPFAILLVKLCIPWFNTYAGTEVSLSLTTGLWVYPAVAGILLITGLIAGSYPALFVSSFKPQEVLQGKNNIGLGSASLRKGLVGFQFLTGIVMIAITVLIIQQLDFVLQKNLGFDSDKLVRIRISDPGLIKQGDAVMREFLNLASVEAATASLAPATGRFGGIGYVFDSDSIPDKKYSFTTPYVDEHFIETMGIKLLSGRNMIPKQAEDTTRIEEALLNETAVKTLGFTDNSEVINRLVANRYRIVGVVEDFHLKSLQHEIEPALLRFNPFGSTYVVNVRLAGGSVSNGLDDLRSVWADKLGADGPLNYTFVDDLIQQQYEEEKNTAKVIGIFSGLSILIASMGLFGLAAFTTQLRFKEIGIRKVLGASISNIVVLLYKDFGVLILGATFISIPIIYYAGNKWLENFAYSIEISPIIFLIAIIVVAFITLVATGTRSLQAALMNPVDSIRQE